MCTLRGIKIKQNISNIPKHRSNILQNNGHDCV